MKKYEWENVVNTNADFFCYTENHTILIKNTLEWLGETNFGAFVLAGSLRIETTLGLFSIALPLK